MTTEVPKIVYKHGYQDYPYRKGRNWKTDVPYICIYLFIIITLIIVGSLYEEKVIHQTKQHTEDSEWIYGIIILCCMPILLVFFNVFFDWCKPNEDIKRYFWCFSHMLSYFALAFVAPGQWPFWLAIGVSWEFFECYRPRTNSGVLKYLFGPGRTSCNGMSDIITNLAGISIAMWIRSEVDVKQLEKSQAPFKIRNK